MLGKITMRPAVIADAAWLARDLRPSDMAEVLAVHPDPVLGIAMAIEGSAICDVAEGAGGGLFVIGCAAGPGHGVPWLVGVNAVNDHPGALTKITKRYVASFLERWPVLLNYVDERNTTSVRWLQRLGFKMHDPVAFGLNGERFLPFSMGR